MNDFAAQAARYGLQINFDKTKVLTWDYLVTGSRIISIGEHSVDILSETQTERYLGRKLCMQDCQHTELMNIIYAAWAAFHKHKGELCSKFYRLEDRTKLFESVFTPSALYGCEAWALAKAMCSELDVARRKMLRYVFRIHRRRSTDVEESWVDFMARSARRIEDLSTLHRLDNWSAV